ncbi:MAG: Holliday junction branch migration DNA helicase RuvB [Candidatus Cloacimonetes bacterium]|nr:Holliday junction branch migration DNA helicase RuvB [Candidatus Cloacimonadota bacterium]
MSQDLTSPEPIDTTDEHLDQSLRPTRLSDYKGQEQLKGNLKIFLQAAKKRNEALEHVLFYGPPGLGKTTLAHILSAEMGVNIRVTSGPAIERAGDLASILTNLEEHDILFIDEIHRLNKIVEETMYPAMEDYCLDLIIGKGPSARTLRLDLNRFTIIGATTRIGLMSGPLRDRFGVTYRLDFYDTEALKDIVKRSALVLGVTIDNDACCEIARRARGTPRVANRLLKRVRDFAEVKEIGKIDKTAVNEALNLLDVDLKGLDGIDRKLLTTIIEKFSGGPVGIETLSAAIAEDIGTIEEVIEPFLLQQGLLKRTPRGRQATPTAYKHLGLTAQKELF